MTNRASLTAEYMALFRALESSRPATSRLFVDADAALFLRGWRRWLARLATLPAGRQIAERLLDRASPGARAAGVARTKWIDDEATGALQTARQLVLLGAGFDMRAFRLLAAKLKRLGRNNPILLKDCLVGVQPSGCSDKLKLELQLEPRIALLRASVVIGALLADGIGDAILIRGEAGGGQSLRLAYNILQAASCRSFKTDYVACPSCGRTLFNLQTVTARIRARTEHLKGVKIAIMGCIVNGPGEMADADFGYVGGAPGKINLYVGKQAIKFNIPETEAVDRLVDLIKEHNKWVEPENQEQKIAQTAGI